VACEPGYTNRAQASMHLASQVGQSHLSLVRCAIEALLNFMARAASDVQRARSARLDAMWRRSRREAPRQAATVAARVGCCRDLDRFHRVASSRSYRGSRQGSRECRLAGCLEGGRSASRVLAMRIAITQGRKPSPLLYRIG